MMLTKEQALTEREFHHGECNRIIGPRGGVTVTQEIWRRNGQTQIWKTRPDHFRVPIKYGMYSYHEITHDTAKFFHAASECPLLREEVPA